MNQVVARVRGPERGRESDRADLLWFAVALLTVPLALGTPERPLRVVWPEDSAVPTEDPDWTHYAIRDLLLVLL